MIKFSEINGKEIIDDLFSTRDNQLETEKSEKTDDKVSEAKAKPKKVRKPRTPKKKE
jgi:hypothetical protein